MTSVRIAFITVAAAAAACAPPLTQLQDSWRNPDRAAVKPR